jgi:hypothetical protein
VNGPRMCSFNAGASLRVRDAVLVVSKYILVVFLDSNSLECFRCSIFSFLGLALLHRRICAWLCSFFGDSGDWFRRALTSSYRPIVFYFWFSAELVLPSYSYFIPADTLSPLWLNYHQYMICLVTSRI